jgi:putative intracellular protease/amidase
MVWDVLQCFDVVRKRIAGIGTGCLALAHAGLLVGKPATCESMPEMINDLKLHGGLYLPEPLVITGWIMTAQLNAASLFADSLLDASFYACPSPFEEYPL